MLIHLIDGSSPQLDNQFESVNRILDQLKLDHIPRLLVLNKTDIAVPEEIENRSRVHGAIAISALDRRTLPPLTDEISRLLPRKPGEKVA